MLDSSEAMSICLHDTSSKRGWLVSGTEMILCLIHMRHRRKNDASLKPSTLPLLEYAAGIHDGARACRTAILKMASVKLISNEQVAERDFYVRGLVVHILSRLETLQSLVDGPGMEVKLNYHSS